MKKIKPKNKKELIKIIQKECEEKGWECDLNFIDTSLITGMSELFSKKNKLDKFNGDISEWDVSNVEYMIRTFEQSKFNGDISKWKFNIRTNMSGMFSESKFNGDISKWDVSSVKNMQLMFSKSKFNGDISKWNVSNVRNMSFMFSESKFDGDISDWKTYSLEAKTAIFKDCKIDIPYWYKNYKSDDKERRDQIDSYHLNKKIEKKLMIKQDKLKKI